MIRRCGPSGRRKQSKSAIGTCGDGASGSGAAPPGQSGRSMRRAAPGRWRVNGIQQSIRVRDQHVPQQAVEAVGVVDDCLEEQAAAGSKLPLAMSCSLTRVASAARGSPTSGDVSDREDFAIDIHVDRVRHAGVAQQPPWESQLGKTTEACIASRGAPMACRAAPSVQGPRGPCGSSASPPPVSSNVAIIASRTSRCSA